MSQAAQEMQRLADEMKSGEEKAVAKKSARKRGNGAKGEAKRDRKAKVAKAPKERLATSGLKAKPKGKSLFVNTDGALTVMHKALKALLKADPSDAERFDAERLVARLESRIG
jgi:hypothetical protein